MQQTAQQRLQAFAHAKLKQNRSGVRRQHTSRMSRMQKRQDLRGVQVQPMRKQPHTLGLQVCLSQEFSSENASPGKIQRYNWWLSLLHPGK